MHQEIKDKIRGYFTRAVKSYAFRDDENIFDTGLVNSMFSMQLLLFIESEFSIVIPDSDLERENFQSIRALSSLVEKNSPK